jgi:uncharacterized membrane protein
MPIKNPVKFNTWKYNDFILVILGIQLLLLYLIALDISILRQIVGFFYLTFIPGYIILRIFKLRDLSNIETIFYALGLSLATLFLCGFFLCIISILFGFAKPLSFLPIIGSTTSLVIILCIISYFREVNNIESFNDIELIDLDFLISPTALFLYLLPFLAIIGTFIINHYNNNLAIMLLIVIIGIIIYLASINKISKKYYVLTIFVISLSLIFQNSLISPYLSGFDVQREYYFAHYIFNLASWSPFGNTITNTIGPEWLSLNSILSISILPIIYSRILDLDLIWVFKIIYPLLLSLIPLGLYKVFKDQTNDRIAFLACIFFISNYSFFYNMLNLMREIIAEIFLVLFILIIISNKKSNSKFIILLISIMSLTVSHYGIAYLFLFLLATVWIINSNILLNLVEKIITKFLNLLKKITNLKYISTQKKSLTTSINSIIFLNLEKIITSLKYITAQKKSLTTSVLIFSFLFIILWYIEVSDSQINNVIVNVISVSFNTFLAGSHSTQGMDIITTKAPQFLIDITKYFILFTQMLIGIGIVTQIFNFDKLKINRDFYMLSIASFALCIGTLLIPNLGSSIDSIRVYQMSLIFLAPFCVLGFIFLFKIVIGILNRIFGKNKILTVENGYKTLTIFFVIFLFFNTGLVHEIMHVPYKPTYSLTSATDPPIFYEQDIASAKWLSNNKNENRIYADTNGYVLLNSLVGFQTDQLEFSEDIKDLSTQESNTYIFLRTKNLDGIIYVVKTSQTQQTSEGFIDKKYLVKIIDNRNKIFDDGSVIYSDETNRLQNGTQ